MKVVMLSWEYPPKIVGGLARHVHDLSKALVKQGVEVDVITCVHEDAPVLENDEGVTVHRVVSDDPLADFLPWIAGLNRAMARKGAELLEADRGRVLHAHDWLTCDCAVELKHRFKVPLIGTIHATEQGRQGGIHGETSSFVAAQEWRLTYEAWRVITVSHFMKKEVARIHGCPSDKLDAIYNGVIAEKFEGIAPNKEFRSRFALPDEKIVLFVGRMVQEKGAQVLIAAMPAVLATCPEAKLVIVGGGYRDHLVEMAETLGISHKVQFTGYVDDPTLLGIYKIASAAVFPSLYEPFGIVALEGMAAGVPVIVSDAGGLREVVDAGVTGVVTQAGNPGSLAFGITQVLKSPDGAANLVQNASRKVREAFCWDRIADQTRGVYDQVWKEYLASGWGDQR